MRYFYCIFIVFFFTACSQRLLDFTILSTKNIDVETHQIIKGKERITGIDKTRILIFIPTGSPDIKEAIDNAIENVPNCVGIIDGVVYSKFWYIPYIYGEVWYEVEGTPIFYK